MEAGNYAVLYSGERPVTFEGEREKDMAKSIRMIPSKTCHNLDDRSRLHYAEPFTIEYNVKVWFIGEVCPDSERQLVTDYKRVNPSLDRRRVSSDTQCGDRALDDYDCAQPSGYSAQSAEYRDNKAYEVDYCEPVSQKGLEEPIRTREDLDAHYRGDEVEYARPRGYSSQSPGYKYSGAYEGHYDEPGAPEKQEGPIWASGDPLRDPDSDDNGDQGDQDRGGGQKRR